MQQTKEKAPPNKPVSMKTQQKRTPQYNTTVSPIKLATPFLKNKHATLLHPEIIIIITCFHLEFFKLKSFIYNKTNILKRMETDDNYIPKSYQLKFNLTSSANTKELPGFKELKTKPLTLS
eukprot:44388-Ditylum_brightwellii.AAC.1